MIINIVCKFIHDYYSVGIKTIRMAASVGDFVFIFFVGVMCLFAVISNSMVIIAVWKVKKMRNVTNILICNLSVSDIILAGIILPQNLHDLSHEEDFKEGECPFFFFITIILV